MRKAMFALVCLLVILPSASRAEVVTSFVTTTNAAATNVFAGIVGIGTSSPSANLHVAGDTRVDGGLDVSGAVTIPRQGDVLMGAYTNGGSSGGMSYFTGLGNLTDVSAASPSTGDLLRFDGTNWVNTSGFVGRDATAADWSVGDLTTDGTDQSLSLTNIVPVGAKSVLVKVLIKDDLVSRGIFLFPTDPAAYNFVFVRTQVANVFNDAAVTVTIDSDRALGYKTSNTAFTTLSITILGWWY